MRTSHTLAGVLTRLREGNRAADPELGEALDRAFGKHTEALERYCARELRGFSAENVEEVAQDVLLEAWRLLPVYQRDQPFRAFLWGIASKKCANLRRRIRDVLSEDGEVELEAQERSVLGRIADEARNQLVDTAARNVLSPQEQEMAHLRWVMDYPYEEIARQLDLPSSDAVRVGLQRCKRRLYGELTRLLAERGLGESFLDEGR